MSQTQTAILRESRVAARSVSLRRCPNCGREGAQDWLTAPDRFHGRHVWYSLVYCKGCSLIWLENPPAPQEMAAHYGPDYDRLIASVGERSSQHWTTRRDTLLKFKQKGRLLDLGCSSGSFLQLLNGTDWQLQGVEISEESARRAEARSGAKVFVGDVLDARFEPNTFDAVTCFHVFEHMYDPRAVVRKVWTWLKPGGIFFMLVPNIDCREARIFKSYWYPLELPRHLFHFSPASIKVLSTSAGFNVLSVSTERVSFTEYHVRYLADALFEKMGSPRVPPACAKEPGITWKVIRKFFRLTAYPLVSCLVTGGGPGQIMQAIVQKPEAAPAVTAVGPEHA